ncbi:cation:H+ antiporter [Ilumatobacter fluminis]|uniref:Cation:H+ antiporter n=1 Tax=Ilumatobacter fluminis TaxID=467091 RepID=A0A4R7HWS2_9ACTN|nr:sodium:calcium antiporter [Ilumatobacter fluminis]TDT15481.1 cation:H+ antiporter [Ilumatobacter fluminis]
MVVVWIVALIGGVVLAAVGSRRAVTSALVVSDRLGVSAGLVGVTVLAVGTDLPEIANSISASVTGHGDLNVGNATGSALTQITLVLALLIAASGFRLDLRERLDVVVTTGVATVIGLVLLLVLVSDGTLSRLDGLLLVTLWLASILLLRQSEPTPLRPRGGSGVGLEVGTTLLWLAIVAGAATVVVYSFVELADRFGVPEFVASALVLSLGTSLPELVVDWTAVRRGAGMLAIGDLFGSSLVDATLAAGIGPLIRSISVSDTAIAGTIVIAVGCAAATLVVATVRHPPVAATLLLGVYAAAVLVVVLV